jgi:flagellar hook-basal body complex protein FliE
MTIGSVVPGLRILPADFPAQIGTVAKSGEGSSFSQNLREAVAGVDDLQLDAQQKVAGLIQGNGVDVHEAMIAVEKADIGFQLAVQMRNKVVQAYQQIASMQF